MEIRAALATKLRTRSSLLRAYQTDSRGGAAVAQADASMAAIAARVEEWIFKVILTATLRASGWGRKTLSGAQLWHPWIVGSFWRGWPLA